MKIHYLQRHDTCGNVFVSGLFLKEMTQRKPYLTMEYALHANRERAVLYLKKITLNMKAEH
jgi:hypothetical protein